MDFGKYINLKTNANHVFTTMSKFFRMKKQLNTIFFVSIIGCSMNILCNIMIYKKLSSILDSINNDNRNKTSKNNTDK